MVDKVQTAIVSLWGHQVGAVSWLEDRGHSIFEYDPDFISKGLEVSPIHMGLDEARRGDGIFSFTSLNKDTFLGLPGLLADALPDKFGNSIIDAWLARQGRSADSFSPVERLCYTGARGMGALEFSPPVNRALDRAVPVEVAELVSLAQEITQQRGDLYTELQFDAPQNGEAIADILRVGTSAGGARPKAIIAMNEQGKVMSGQADIPEGYHHWLLKFDGVTDIELGEPKGFGRIEFAYYLMAKAAGINMSECRLLEENGRAHFMTKRFDRLGGDKRHMQSLCGLAHYDFNQAGLYSYEQAFEVMRKLRLSKADALQQYRRMLFNVIARNQDDHTKNITFLMTPDGQWQLSPAFDVTYSHNPAGRWTNQHQMSINGKRDHFSLDDLVAVGESISLPRPIDVIEEVMAAVDRWPEFANQAGVKVSLTGDIARNHRYIDGVRSV
ncbi:type II toxin-antitoxin system HipA family toxin [Pseudomonadota bacterium]